MTGAGQINLETHAPSRGLGKWGIKGVPHTGWSCVEVIDLGPKAEGGHEICQMCEVMQIRFVQCMTHPNYPDELRCGLICAGNMEDARKAEGRERSMLNAARRRAGRATWQPKWKKSRKGNYYFKHGDVLCIMFMTKRGWSYRLDDVNAGQSFSDRLTCMEHAVETHRTLWQLEE